MGLAALRHVDLPRPGIEPECPALAGGFFTTGPLRKVAGGRVGGGFLSEILKVDF